MTEKTETLTEMVERVLNITKTIEATLNERCRLLGGSFEEKCAGVALQAAVARLNAAHLNLVRHDEGRGR